MTEQINVAEENSQNSCFIWSSYLTVIHNSINQIGKKNYKHKAEQNSQFEFYKWNISLFKKFFWLTFHIKEYCEQFGMIIKFNLKTDFCGAGSWIRVPFTALAVLRVSCGCSRDRRAATVGVIARMFQGHRLSPHFHITLSQKCCAVDTKIAPKTGKSC